MPTMRSTARGLSVEDAVGVSTAAVLGDEKSEPGEAAEGVNPSVVVPVVVPPSGNPSAKKEDTFNLNHSFKKPAANKAAVKRIDTTFSVVALGQTNVNSGLRQDPQAGDML